jgi:multidrug resistance efflux pump
MIDRLAAEAAEARGEVSAATARLANAEAVRRRSIALAARGLTSETQSEADTAARDEAAGDVARLHAKIGKIEVERMAADRGISVQDSASDVPYSQQRLDEIRMRSAALEAEHRRVSAELSALDRQIEAEAEQTARRQTFRPIAPASGVVWKSSGAAGETVVPGDILVQTVDCAARFVEVTLPERHFGDISPGDPARVQLKGGGEMVEVPVGAVLGAGAKFDHPRLAAGVFEPNPDQLRILIPLDGEALAGDPAAFCNVGRTAEVRFPHASAWSLRGLVASGGAIVSSLFGPADTSAATADTAAPADTGRMARLPGR